MSRVQIPKSTEPCVAMPGSWHFDRLDSGPVVWISCPQCGQHALLDHGVLENGEVIPSLLCDCGFHEMVQLEDWTYGIFKLKGRD